MLKTAAAGAIVIVESVAAGFAALVTGAGMRLVTRSPHVAALLGGTTDRLLAGTDRDRFVSELCAQPLPLALTKIVHNPGIELKRRFDTCSRAVHSQATLRLQRLRRSSCRQSRRRRPQRREQLPGHLSLSRRGLLPTLLVADGTWSRRLRSMGAGLPIAPALACRSERWPSRSSKKRSARIAVFFLIIGVVLGRFVM